MNYKQIISYLLPSHKIILVGDCGVGKSALTVRMVANEFNEEYDSTIEANYTSVIQMDGRFRTVDIFDTAGSLHWSLLFVGFSVWICKRCRNENME